MQCFGLRSSVFYLYTEKFRFNPANEFTAKNIKGYFERKVTKFGTGAKVDMPKEHLGREVVILVCED